MTQSRKMTWTVVTIDGNKTTHTYDVPTNIEALRKLVNQTTTYIIGAFTGRYKLLMMTDPFILYNPSNIVCIQFDSFGSEELQAILERAQRRIGFPIASKSN